MPGIVEVALAIAGNSSIQSETRSSHVSIGSQHRLSGQPYSHP
jgi:hypothetical protein